MTNINIGNSGQWGYSDLVAALTAIGLENVSLNNAENPTGVYWYPFGTAVNTFINFLKVSDTSLAAGVKIKTTCLGALVTGEVQLVPTNTINIQQFLNYHVNSNGDILFGFNDDGTYKNQLLFGKAKNVNDNSDIVDCVIIPCRATSANSSTVISQTTNSTMATNGVIPIVSNSDNLIAAAPIVVQGTNYVMERVYNIIHGKNSLATNAAITFNNKSYLTSDMNTAGISAIMAES